MRPRRFGRARGRHWLVLVAVFLAVSSPASGGALLKGPYLQNVRPDSVVIMWESQSPAVGVVLVENGTESIQKESSEGRLQEMRIDGLLPGTRYHYSVQVSGEKFAGEFATAPALPGPFSFVVYGDSRSNKGTHTRVVERVRSEVPDFLVSTGDLVNEGASASDWQTFFEVEGPLLRDNVLFPSLGNHDRQGRGKTADNYRAYFSVPENSPNPERYYGFTYANARFLVLDSNSHSFSLTDQTAWIEEQLQVAHMDPKIEHIFVTMHHPPYSVSLHGGQRELREAWTPLFERYNVGAVFSGHDHVYSRAERNGVRYFVSGGGGAPLYPRKKRPGSLDEQTNKNFERVNHYLRVHVFGSLVEITAVRVDGSVIETVTYGDAPRLSFEAPDIESLENTAKISAVGASPPTKSGHGPISWFVWLGVVLACGAVMGMFWSLVRSR